MSDAAATIDAWFEAQTDLDVDRLDGAWFTVLAGEHKRAIPVHLALGAAHLTLQSFFMRAPDENEADVYRLLLRRHTRSYLLRFALTAAGDVVLVGLLPRTAVTPDELDRLLGQLLQLADDTFNAALRAGFAGYIAREQAWRERSGAARNPVS